MVTRKYSIEFMKSIADKLNLGGLLICHDGCATIPISINRHDNGSPQDSRVQRKYNIVFLKEIAIRLNLYPTGWPIHSIDIEQTSLPSPPSLVLKQISKISRKYSIEFLKAIGKQLQVETLSYIEYGDSDPINHKFDTTDHNNQNGFEQTDERGKPRNRRGMLAYSKCGFKYHW